MGGPVTVPAAAPKAEAVYFHAWKNDEDGNQNHCEADEGPDGWCVYTRYADEASGGPDLSDEQDFPDRDSALIEAEARAARLGVEAREY